MEGGQTSLYEERGLYTMRRARPALSAWLDVAQRAQESVPGGGAFVHFGATLPMAPSALVRLPTRERALPDSAVRLAMARLSDDDFLFAALAAGWIDEVYWVQPGVSCFAGPPEALRFALAEGDDRIGPAAREGAAIYDPAPGLRAALEGRPVSRLREIEVAAGLAQEDWADGPFTVHCLGREHLREILEARAHRNGLFVNVDLDYFGSAPELSAHGYLALFDESDVAVGLLGGGVTVFRHPPDSLWPEVAEVAELVRDLAPVALTLVESADRAHAETLPRIESALRSAWLSRSATDLAVLIPEVSLAAGAGPMILGSECTQFHDLGRQDSLRISLEWAQTPPEPLEISLLFDPTGAGDRLVARWRTLADRQRIRVSVPLDFPDAQFRPGWELEVRRWRDGALVYHGSFTLDRAGGALAAVVEAWGEGGPLPLPEVDRLAGQSAAELISWGMQSQLPAGVLHRILLAHPRALEDRCEDLRHHWIARARSR